MSSRALIPLPVLLLCSIRHTTAVTLGSNATEVSALHSLILIQIGEVGLTIEPNRHHELEHRVF
jgi:hypothetical protein